MRLPLQNVRIQDGQIQGEVILPDGKIVPWQAPCPERMADLLNCVANSARVVAAAALRTEEFQAELNKAGSLEVEIEDPPGPPEIVFGEDGILRGSMMPTTRVLHLKVGAIDRLVTPNRNGQFNVHVSSQQTAEITPVNKDSLRGEMMIISRGQQLPTKI